jgi:hypothetical protein
MQSNNTVNKLSEFGELYPLQNVLDENFKNCFQVRFLQEQARKVLGR